jgi:hypothetical protein
MVSSSNNAFTSMWLDKRSSAYVSISAGFTGTSAPDGYFHLETSDAPENTKSTYGSGPFIPTPGSIPWDTFVVANSVQAPSIGVRPNTWFARWESSFISARWIRVVYVPNTEIAGLMAFVWANVPFMSS